MSAKEALVIGNSAYGPNLALACPSRDCRAMETALRDLGFHVTADVDVTYERAQELVEAFISRVNEPETKTSLLYYSGHGLQIEGDNYIVPVDFDRSPDENRAKLICVQSIVDRMTSATSVRIVLLDACRSNADARAFVGGKGIETGEPAAKGGDVGKVIFVAQQQVLPRGLAEIRTSSNTFVGFAAAPGAVAYDGVAGAALSPFTASLVKYLDAVDVPISNLTSRVRQDVLNGTQGRQRTWDQSSLMAPFYFNPGQLFLLMGNFMALLGVALAMVPFSLVMAWPDAPLAYKAVAAALPTLSLAILLGGMQGVYARLRGAYRFGEDGNLTVRDHLATSVRKGVLGGYLGSLIASLLIGWAYMAGWDNPREPSGKILLEITVATASTACLLSALSLFFSRVSPTLQGLRISGDRSARRLVRGAALGGTAAGALAAPVLTVHFGLIQDRPIMSPQLLLPGAIVGTALLIFTIVNFDFERLSLRRARTSFGGVAAGLGLGAIFGLAVFGTLAALGIVGAIIDWMVRNAEDATVLALGGLAYGLPAGLVLGITCGCALVFTERWSGKPVV